MNRELKHFLFLSLTAISLSASAAKNTEHKTIIEGPWMTGPLLAPAGNTIPKGHINLEPYLFYTDNYGRYEENSKTKSTPNTTHISPTMIFSAGLTTWMDFTASLPYEFNSKSGQSDNGVGDTSLNLGFQLINDKPHTAIPALRVTIEETFPTGDYKNLSATKLGTQATGAGLYQTNISANFQKLIYLNSGKYVSARLSLSDTFSSKTTVTGFNAFGGGFGTNGTVNSGNQFSADFSLEYTLTQHWVPAIDVVAAFADKTTFRGTAGTNNSGQPASTGGPSSDTISLAPAIEYNLSSKIGVIVGAWFSVYGRNTPDFISGVGAINLYF